jgi:hypothetical protein
MSNYTLRDASRDPSFFNGKIDVKVAFPFLILTVFPSWFNLFLCLLLIVFFGVLGFFGIKVPVFIKMIGRKFRGKKVYARPWWLRARWAVDAKNVEQGKSAFANVKTGIKE